MALAIAAGGWPLIAELAVQSAACCDDAAVLGPDRRAAAAVRLVGTRLFLMFARALRATEADRNRARRASCKTLTTEFEATASST